MKSPAARELFERLDLDGKAVHLDVLHTQAETARAWVLEHGADYLLTVKGNQPTVQERIARHVATPPMASPLKPPRAWPARTNAIKAGPKPGPSARSASRRSKPAFPSPPKPPACAAKSMAGKPKP